MLTGDGSDVADGDAGDDIIRISQFGGATANIRSVEGCGGAGNDIVDFGDIAYSTI